MPWTPPWKRSKSAPVAKERRDSGYESVHREEERQVYNGGKTKQDSEPSMPLSTGNREPISTDGKRPVMPAAVHEAYEATSPSRPEEPQGPPGSLRYTPLSEDELKYVFSGAPHFILEKGVRSQWHPHALFPWDESSSIQNLRDRTPLYRPSFALATLHAHLPPFDEPGGIHPHPRFSPEALKRKGPTFDIGVFEVPNMLSSRAKEAGCVGYCYFLESPIAPLFRSRAPVPYKFTAEKDWLRAMESGPLNEPYSDCRSTAVLDRLQVIKEGPEAWRRLGIRDCTVRSIAERIQTISGFRDDIISRVKPATILDMQPVPALYNELFTTFLYPPPKGRKTDNSTESSSLRTQIEVLMRVLTVKGAWIDMSLTEWRIRLGQVLWEATPHQDGDCIEHPADESVLGADAERKWLLLQILLTAELIVRIDAAVKIGLGGNSQSVLQINPHDVHQINSLRTEKLDWDIVCCRWTLDNLTFQYLPTTDQINPLESYKRPKRERIRERLSFPISRRKPAAESAWDCLILPRFPYRQLDGLFHFTEFLGWPGVDAFKERMKSNVQFAMSDSANMCREFALPLNTSPLPDKHKRLDRKELYQKCRSSWLVQLQMPPSPDRPDEDSPCPSIRGWMSRTWMSGLVLPGDAISALLIATLLENDPDAMRALGPIANLYGGFVYKNASWWSTMTIVGRILSCLEGSSMVVGWISTPVAPRDKDGKLFSDGWFEIEARDDPKSLEMPRIYQGSKVFLDSSPLGVGNEVTSQSYSIPLDDPDAEHASMQVAFKNMTLVNAGKRLNDPTTALFPRKVTAAASFTVTQPDGSSEVATFSLAYNIQFVSSYTCLPPPGRITRFYTDTSRRESRHVYRPLFEKPTEGGDIRTAVGRTQVVGPGNKYRRRSRLPGHPLHTRSYPHTYIPLSSLPTMSSLPTVPGEEYRKDPWPYRRKNQRKHTFILDARGSKDKESFARAWCAAIGTNAVVGRVGRTCLACCIREARAVDAGVVIRVGALDTVQGGGML